MLMTVPSVSKRRPHWILYNKNDKLEPQITNKLHFDEIINLPNIGREGQTFLHHMINRRDDLADHTIFCQEEPHRIGNVLSRLENQFISRTGFLSLSSEMLCNCGECSAKLQPMSEVYALLSQRLCHERFMSSLTGCFLVSRERIRSVPIERLEYLKELIEAPEDHFIHNPDLYDDKLGIDISTRSNPYFGHVLERLWSVVFNCSDSQLFRDMLRDYPYGIGPQCFD